MSLVKTDYVCVIQCSTSRTIPVFHKLHNPRNDSLMRLLSTVMSLGHFFFCTVPDFHTYVHVRSCEKPLLETCVFRNNKIMILFKLAKNQQEVKSKEDHRIN